MTGCLQKTDFGLLTLIAADDVPGLQLCLRGGTADEEEFYTVRPRFSDKIFCTCGDFLSIASCGKFLSPLHRTLLPGELEVGEESGDEDEGLLLPARRLQRDSCRPGPLVPVTDKNPADPPEEMIPSHGPRRGPRALVQAEAATVVTTSEEEFDHVAGTSVRELDKNRTNDRFNDDDDDELPKLASSISRDSFRLPYDLDGMTPEIGKLSPLMDLSTRVREKLEREGRLGAAVVSLGSQQEHRRRVRDQRIDPQSSRIAAPRTLISASDHSFVGSVASEEYENGLLSPTPSFILAQERFSGKILSKTDSGSQLVVQTRTPGNSKEVDRGNEQQSSSSAASSSWEEVLENGVLKRRGGSAFQYPARGDSSEDAIWDGLSPKSSPKSGGELPEVNW